MYIDKGNVIGDAYGHSLGVPYIVVVDREGRIRTRQTGADGRIEAILTMEIRNALGVENKLLLDRKGYSGEEACRVCHTGQHQTWALTNHAYAFETLVEHGQDGDPECLPCHTVGWEKPGGYSLDNPLPHLRGVQCENCHGRGGPHQSPEFKKQGMDAVCETCHTTTHSLNFDFASRLPEVSHSANSRIANLSADERRALLEARDKQKRSLFGSGDFVGSAACQECHAKEHARWSESDHARAFATLEGKHEGANADCQECHTTGFSKPGGFPAGGEALRDVGCESCHGPGGAHVKADAKKKGNILALADKCDSCVILQICGSCHDDQNDPGFEFEVLDKIEIIRHGSPATASTEP